MFQSIEEKRAELAQVVREMRDLADRAGKHPKQGDEDLWQHLSKRSVALETEIRTDSAVSGAFTRAGAKAGVSTRSAMSDETRAAFTKLHGLIDARSTGAVELDRRAYMADPGEHGLRPQFVAGDYATAQPQILSLFPNEPSTGPVMRVYKTSTAATAGAVAEGAAKPAAGLVLSPQDITMQKLAVIQKVSEEFRMDMPNFFAQIPAELARAIAVSENTYAYGVISGDSGLSTGTSANVQDGVADAIATLFADFGVQADGLVLNPADLAAARKATATGSGVYVFEPSESGPATLHGLPFTVSNSVPSGTVLVGSFATAGIAYRRDELRVEVGYDADDWSKNLVTLRVEERVGLGLTRPGHIVKLTVSAG